MNQSTVRAMLSRLTEQLVSHFAEDGEIKRPKEFAEQLSAGTWNGLILLLRQSIANSDRVLLEEVGVLKKVDDKWLFEPAASIAEVDAMVRPLPEADKQLAQTSVFYLEEALDLLASVHEDQELAQPETRTGAGMWELFTTDASQQRLSARLMSVSRKLTGIAMRLHAGEAITNQKMDFTVVPAPPKPIEYDLVASEPQPYPPSLHDRIRDLREQIESGRRAYQEEKKRQQAADELNLDVKDKAALQTDDNVVADSDY